MVEACVGIAQPHEPFQINEDSAKAPSRWEGEIKFSSILK
jgi:hypothetical protein